MKLTVHIGTTKTGSTSIQAFLRSNRAVLAAQGISYPAVLGAQHHIKAAVSALNFRQSRDLLTHQGIQTPRALEAYRVKVVNAYQEVIRRGAKHVIISSEHLQSRCNQPDNIERFRELFATGFDEVQIIVYVRPQLDQLVSLYSTTLRNGASETMHEHIERHISGKLFTYFDLQGIVQRWGAVFGEDRIIVRPYKAVPPQSKGGVVADFCLLLGLRHDDPAFTPPLETNSSIDERGQELLRIVNSNAGLDLERRRQVVAWVETNCSGKGAEPDLARAREFQKRFDEGNAWVVSRYFPDHPEYLEPRWPKV